MPQEQYVNPHVKVGDLVRIIEAGNNAGFFSTGDTCVVVDEALPSGYSPRADFNEQSNPRVIFDGRWFIGQEGATEGCRTRYELVGRQASLFD